MDVPTVDYPAPSDDGISMVVGGQELLVDVEHPLHKAFVIRGRGTCTMPCKRGTDKCVVKLSWPEETRQTEPEILGTVKERAGNCPEIMNHISEVIGSEVFDETSTDKIRIALGLPSHPRRLVVTVLRRCKGKISQLSDWKFWKVWWECFICEHIFLSYHFSPNVYLD